MVVDVILLQDSTPVVIEINTDLFSAVNSIVSQYWIATCGDPHSSQGVGVNLIAFNQTSTIVMLCETVCVCVLRAECINARCTL